MSNKMTSDFIPLNEPWLVKYNISKYTDKIKYDGREHNRPVLAGKIPSFIKAREKMYRKRIDTKVKTSNIISEGSSYE